MSPTLVMNPDVGFHDLSDLVLGSGWRIVDQSAQPLLPDEPEYVVFEKAPDGSGSGAQRLVYTFNPVCRLRLLEVSDPGRTRLPALPMANALDVAAWLASEDDRTLLRGLLAARHLREPGLLDRVEAHTAHPRPSLAEAASASAHALRMILAERGAAEEAAGGLDARERSRAAIEILKEQLQPLLRSLCQDADGTLSRSLRPRDDDYGRAFRPDVAEAARRAYNEVWDQGRDQGRDGAGDQGGDEAGDQARDRAGGTGPRVDRAPPDSRVECHVAPAGMLADENELSFHFPGGYRAIAHLLDPHRVWVRWRYLRPGADAGVSYDGLVWLDDHWAWFPKPYRVLRPLVEK